VLARFKNLELLIIPDASVVALAGIAQRAMRLQCTIQDGTTFITDGEKSLEITPVRWKLTSKGFYLIKPAQSVDPIQKHTTSLECKNYFADLQGERHNEIPKSCNDGNGSTVPFLRDGKRCGR